MTNLPELGFFFNLSRDMVAGRYTRRKILVARSKFFLPRNVWHAIFRALLYMSSYIETRVEVREKREIDKWEYEPLSEYLHLISSFSLTF